MKRTTMLALLGLACLMAVPQIAHARYRDGMNLYQYVQSAPTTYVDPMGLQKVKGNDYGDWDILQANTHVTRQRARYNSDVLITFIPNKKTVCCDEITFIQAVRRLDSADKPRETRKTFADRMTADGWAIDRLANQKHPEYPYRNNGTVSPSWGTTGSSPTPYKVATLWDTPSDVVPDQKWYFETVSICKKGDQEKTVYGALRWGFNVDKSGKLTSHNPYARDLYSLDFLGAAFMWNMQALGHTAIKNDPDQELILIQSQFGYSFGFVDGGIVVPAWSEDTWKEIGKDYARRKKP